MKEVKGRAIHELKELDVQQLDAELPNGREEIDVYKIEENPLGHSWERFSAVTP